MAKGTKKARPLIEDQLTQFLPEKSELQSYEKYKNKSGEELDEVAQDYVKLAFLLIEITKHRASENNKKFKRNI